MSERCLYCEKSLGLLEEYYQVKLVCKGMYPRDFGKCCVPCSDLGQPLRHSGAFVKEKVDKA